MKWDNAWDMDGIMKRERDIWTGRTDQDRQSWKKKMVREDIVYLGNTTTLPMGNSTGNENCD